MFFNFFGKNKKENEVDNNKKNNILASITYYIAENDDSTMINIELGDYDDKSSMALCKILDILSEDISYIETINMIKSSLSQDGQEDLLIKIFSHLSKSGINKLVKSQKESIKNEPCIKPSDMLQ